MAKKGHRIAGEIKDEIINKIKHEGLSVTDAGDQYGVSTKTIYVKGTPFLRQQF
ncbi:MAG TPA: hypothetical protein V6C58_09645 [Allocoleopsis sp.]